MPVRSQPLPKGIQRSPSRKIAVKLPVARSLADLGRDRKHGVPLKKPKIVTGPYRKGPIEELGVHVGTGREGKPQAPQKDQDRPMKPKPGPMVEPSPGELPKQAGAKTAVPAHLARAVATAPLVFRHPTKPN